MVRVLFTAGLHSPIGGIQKWANHIIDYYNTNKSDYIVDVFSEDRNITVAQLSNRLYRIITGILFYSKLVFKLYCTLRKKKYDIIHMSTSASYSIFKDYLFVKIAHKYDCKIIVHYHFGRIPDLKQLNNWEWKWLYKVTSIADGVIVLDERSYNVLKESGFNNIHKLPNPIAPFVLDYTATKEPTRINKRLFFAGQGYRTKGVYELVEACKRIQGVVVRMAGDFGEDMKQELRLLSGNGSWLEFAGQLSFDRVLDEMLSCDMFILPTYTEGFPNVILEAMACKCAIITTNVGAIPEMLENDECGQYGLMVEPRNTEQLYNAIVSLIDDESLKLQFRENVYRRVIERYNISIVWEGLTRVWKNSLN